MAKDTLLFKESHRRFNALTGEWVQVSPHRMKRPWQGSVEKTEGEQRATYDPDCYLCPGNRRADGGHNPSYEGTYVFTNDFAAIVPDLDHATYKDGLLEARSERGICRVVCFSHRHDLTIPELSLKEVMGVIVKWMEECKQLSALPYVNSVQIFENKGSIMGCSNPHPHGQIWAQESIPVEPEKKQKQQREYFSQSGRSLLSDYVDQELEMDSRIIFQNGHFIVLIPFWAAWPFETMIIPKRQMTRIDEMSTGEQKAFAQAYRQLTILYDNLFEVSFPYSAGIHQAPVDGKEYPEWHWHMVFYPPLLRSASVKKFMVGYEMLANPQRDLTAEQAAQTIRALPTIHYKSWDLTEIAQ